ncbi:hypothetical protein UY3_04838 [Chelonia mydas]|uniref:Uncharacterized protein n=1 Tax=Chelonia mydas TaxID=8469 RepID=M7BJ65_CHEMY|nr:hypothetical protein UY3_04838 [Chelonia mydas]
MQLYRCSVALWRCFKQTGESSPIDLVTPAPVSGGSYVSGRSSPVDIVLSSPALRSALTGMLAFNVFSECNGNLNKRTQVIGNAIS